MKKALKIFSRFVLSLAILFTVFSVPAQAKTGSRPASGRAYLSTGKYGTTTTEFTFNTTTTGSTKLYYNCTQGMLNTTVNLNHSPEKCYGYYEVQVWGKKGSTWAPIYVKAKGTQKNIKDSANGYFSVKGYTTYKVKVYAWDTRNFGRTTYHGGGCFYITNDLQPLTGKTYSYPKVSFSWSNAK